MTTGMEGCDGIWEVFFNTVSRKVFGSWDEGTRSPPPAAPFLLLAPDDLSAGAGFGTALDRLLGATVVGAPLDAPNGVRSGSAYLYETDGLGLPPVLQAKLVPDDVGEDAEFGRAIAMSGNLVAIGAPGDATGAVYVYRRQQSGSVDLEAILRAPASGPARFGAAVAFKASELLVGAPGEAGGGSVYVYESPIVGQPSPGGTISASDTSPGDGFGSEITVGHTYLAVGAPGARTFQDVGAGAVYLYRTFGGVTSIFKLGARDAADLAPGAAVLRTEFESEVNLSVFGGTPGADGGATGSGGFAHYFYVGVPTIPRAPDNVSTGGGPGVPAGGGAGTAVAVRDDDQDTSKTRRNLLAVGAPGFVDSPQPVAGSVVVYELRSALAQTVHADTVTAPTPVAGDRFGAALAFSDLHIVVGAPGVDGGRGVVHLVPMKNVPVPSKAAAPPEPADHYLAFRASDDATEPASAERVLGRALRAPFRAEVTAGELDGELAQALDAAAIGVSLTRRGSEPKETFELSLRFTGAGVEASARGPAGDAGAPVTLAGAVAADLAAEHDGQTLRLLARAAGGGEFEEVASVADPGGAFLPGVFLCGLAPGEVLGFDDPVLVNNAAADPATDLPGSIEDLIYEAVDLEVGAIAALDLADAPTEDVKTEWLDGTVEPLGEARTRLLDLQRAAETRRARRGPRRARRHVGRAGRLVRSASRKLVRGRALVRAERQLAIAIRLGSRALEALRLEWGESERRTAG